jgi:hypothetical protein
VAFFYEKLNEAKYKYTTYDKEFYVVGKTLHGEKPLTLKHTKCIVQQLNGYNILQILRSLNSMVA